MKKLLLFLCLISFAVYSKPMLKTTIEGDFNIKQVNSFVLYLVGSMEMVFSFDYSMNIKNIKTENADPKKKEIKKETDEFIFVLPIPNPLKKWEASNQGIFTDLFNATLPEGMPDTTKKDTKSAKTTKKAQPVVSKNANKIIIKDVFKTEEIGQKAFDEINKHLKENNYAELNQEEYVYYIDRNWSFIIIKYGMTNGMIPKEATIEPIYLSLDTDMVAFPLRIFKDTGKVNFDVYVLSQFDLDLSDLSKFYLTTTEIENPKQTQQNRMTIITELGENVVKFYDKIAQNNEVFKDMERTTLKMFHFYGKDINSGEKSISSWSKSNDFNLNNK